MSTEKARSGSIDVMIAIDLAIVRDHAREARLLLQYARTLKNKFQRHTVLRRAVFHSKRAVEAASNMFVAPKVAP